MPTYEKKPMAQLITEAQAGNVESQSALGMLHELGLVPDSNLKEALHWYGKAAKSGRPDALMSLARLHEEGGPGVPQDGKTATSLYSLAATMGYRHPEVRRLEVFPKRKKHCVLLVAEGLQARMQTRSLLEQKGYDVVEANDGQQALRFLHNKGNVDLVVAEVEMSSMDGVELLQLIRQRLQKTNLPVVLLTSQRKLEPLKKAKTFGVQGWLLKPFEDETLLQAVRKAVS